MASGDWGGSDRGPTINAVTWTMTSIALITVVLRFVSRTCFGGNKLGLDDFITMLCVAVLLAAAITMTLAVQDGMGKHIQDIPPEKLSPVTLRILILNSFSIWASSLPKLAIIALLERLLRLKVGARVLFWTLGFLSQVSTISLAVLWWTRCAPVEANYNPLLPGAVCGDFKALEIAGYVASVTNPVLDMFFALYPVPMVMKLNMSFNKRIGVSLGLGIGTIASAVSIYKLSVVPTVVDELTTDPTWGVVPLVLFAHVEAALLIMTAALPTIGPLFRWLQGKVPLTVTRSRKSSDRDTSKISIKYGDASRHRGTKLRSATDTDDVPLVEMQTGSMNSRGGALDYNAYSGIQKTVAISIRHEDA